jgi:hypothetical protein
LHTNRPDSLVAAINHFIERDDKTEMQLMARHSVVERTWSKVNHQLLDHYRAVINEGVSHEEVEVA